MAEKEQGRGRWRGVRRCRWRLERERTQLVWISNNQCFEVISISSRLQRVQISLNPNTPAKGKPNEDIWIWSFGLSNSIQIQIHISKSSNPNGALFFLNNTKMCSKFIHIFIHTYTYAWIKRCHIDSKNCIHNG